MNSIDEKFMLMALKEAKKAFNENEVPVGCVIVHNGKVIARGHNQVMKKKSAIYHAEINAIIKAGKKIGDFRLNECSLYVTLEPCIMCAGAIVNNRIGNVYVGAMDVKRGFCGSIENIFERKELNHKPNLKTGILEDECLEILQSFFKKLRKGNKNEDNSMC